MCIRDSIGTVASPALRDWILDYRRIGGDCGDWARLAQGTSEVNDASLGTFDPTLLLNGLYELKLKARDRFGGLSETVAPVTVHGDMKVGEFTFSTQDLSIQLPGLSLELTRTYHSTKKCADDFGHGWDLDINAVRLFKNAKLGDCLLY